MEEKKYTASRAGSKYAKIKVDSEKCIGAGTCSLIAPGVFQIDELGKAYIADPDAEQDNDLLMAVQSCPVLAIELYDEEDNRVFPQII